MTVFEEYRAKLRTPEQAVQAVKSGDWVDYTTALGFPILLDAALAKRRDELTDVKIRGNLIFGPIQTVECDPVSAGVSCTAGRFFYPLSLLGSPVMT